MLKLAVFDLHDIHNLHDGRQRHAIRRSRRTTLLRPRACSILISCHSVLHTAVLLLLLLLLLLYIYIYFMSYYIYDIRYILLYTYDIYILSVVILLRLLLYRYIGSMSRASRYIYSFPWGMLGIALTGVGFVTAVEQTDESFTRSLLRPFISL